MKIMTYNTHILTYLSNGKLNVIVYLICVDFDVVMS